MDEIRKYKRNRCISVCVCSVLLVATFLFLILTLTKLQKFGYAWGTTFLLFLITFIYSAITFTYFESARKKLVIAHYGEVSEVDKKTASELISQACILKSTTYKFIKEYDFNEINEMFFQTMKKLQLGEKANSRTFNLFNAILTKINQVSDEEKLKNHCFNYFIERTTNLLKNNYCEI